MASLIRLRQLPVVQKCVWNHLNRASTRTISTSKKNSDSAATASAEAKTEEDKNWVSYGFDYSSKEEDTNVHNASFFFSVTLCLVFGGFAWSYAPDTLNRDWTQREAFLELRRREKAGLPPIDPNYVNPKSVKLPSESQLCDVEIII
ncbi:NADH dehydrogenase [ubiquinone] 1 beta subcomplex subunit NP15.6 [Anticarsia gemmatalis]|uniref:NADH dehydrogenase [ubiquinone] 1 beta subcomplex subunit NP15.6 n=1 Tax=Anticarsia gemmatalis TaxID=129554 RepID=UPI003F76C764